MPPRLVPRERHGGSGTVRRVTTTVGPTGSPRSQRVGPTPSWGPNPLWSSDGCRVVRCPSPPTLRRCSSAPRSGPRTRRFPCGANGGSGGTGERSWPPGSGSAVGRRHQSAQARSSVEDLRPRNGHAPSRLPRSALGAGCHSVSRVPPKPGSYPRRPAPAHVGDRRSLALTSRATRRRRIGAISRVGRVRGIPLRPNRTRRRTRRR